MQENMIWYLFMGEPKNLQDVLQVYGAWHLT